MEKLTLLPPSLPLNLREEHVDVMTALVPRLKNGLALVEEEDSVVDLGLAEYELEVLSGGHASKRREVDQQNLKTANQDHRQRFFISDYKNWYWSRKSKS